MIDSILQKLKLTLIGYKFHNLSFNFTDEETNNLRRLINEAKQLAEKLILNL